MLANTTPTDWVSVGVFGAFTVAVLVLSSLLGRRASRATLQRTDRSVGL